MRQLTKLWGLLSLIFLFASCEDQFVTLGEIDGVRYNAEYALPLVDSKIGMRDLLENFEDDASLTVDPDGLLRFRYSGDLLTRTSEDIFAELQRVIGNAGLIPLISNRQALPFSTPDGLDLDRVIMKNTTLIYSFSNAYPFPVTVNFALPTVTLDDVPLTFTSSIPPGGNVNNAGNPIDLTGYNLVPENDSIYLETEYVDAVGQVFTPSAGSGIAINDFAFSYLEGYLGNVTYEGERDTIDIDFFDSWIQGDVYFENPKISFNFENSFGVPTEAVVNLINIITAEGELLPLESVFIDEGGIEFPFPAGNEVGQTKTATFLFDRTNSNIDRVLGSKPVAIDYDVSALTNPDNDTSIRGFVTDSSFYKVLVDVELPLYGNAANFVVRDTFDIDFSPYDKIIGAEFSLVTENGLPLSVTLQGDFIEANGNQVSQLFAGQQPVVGGAPVDANGFPTAPNRLVTTTEFDEAEVTALKTASRLIITATFSTTLGSNQSVRILADQEVDVKLGVILKVADN